MIPTLNLGREPVAIITVIVVALGALNTQVSGLTPTVHNVISAALVVLGALIARAAVTPAAAVQAEQPAAQVDKDGWPA
jgi:hypothetical protein